jgi:hypothetical protein
LLIDDQMPQRCRHVAAVGARCGGPHAVEAHAYHDPVEPRPYGISAVDVGRFPESQDYGVLDGLGSPVDVAEQPDRNRPKLLLVPAEQRAERVRVTLKVPAEQVEVGWRAPSRGEFALGRGAK